MGDLGLKPCPFCGGPAKIESYWNHKLGVVCADDNCKGFWSAKDTKEEAITAWNTRAERTCTVTEYPTGETGVICQSCDSCHYGWHVSINDKPFSYCPNCGAKVVD